MSAGGWAGWLAVVLVSFGVWEWRGLRKLGRRGTLSNLFWFALFTDWDFGRRRPRWVVWLPLFGFFLWLVGHFFFPWVGF